MLTGGGTDWQWRTALWFSPVSRWLLVLLAGAIGAFLSLSAYFVLKNHQQRLGETQFELLVEKRCELVQRALSSRFGAVRTLAAFFEGSEFVTPQEFAIFTRPLLAQYGDTELLAWVEPVPQAERQQHEQRVRQAGMPDYRVWPDAQSQRGDGTSSPDKYWPVVYVQPAAKYQSLLGYDFGAHARVGRLIRRAAAAHRLRHTIRPGSQGPGVWRSAAETVFLPIDKENAAGTGPAALCVAIAVDRQDVEHAHVDPAPAAQSEHQTEPEGFVIGIFRVPELLADSLAVVGPEQVNVYLADRLQSEWKGLLAAYPLSVWGEEASAGPMVMPQFAPGTVTREIPFPDSAGSWTIYFEPTPRYLAARESELPISMLIAGLSLTGLLCGYLVLFGQRAAQAERLVAQRTAQLRTISDSALDAVIMMDHEGRVVHWNPAAERIFGYSAQEIIGRSVHEMLAPARYRDRIARGLAEFARSGQGPVVGKVVELTAVRKDGDEFPIEISVSAIRRDDRWWSVAIVRDITRRRRAEEALLRERRLLHELLDLQERDRKLLAFEVHDGLAQQLTGAIMKLQAVESLREADPAQAAQAAQEALQLLREANRETRRLISGLRPPYLDEQGLGPAVENLVQTQSLRADQQIELINHLPDDRFAPPLESSAFRIVQECLTNACRHSQSQKVQVNLGVVDGKLRIEVQDWGVGFDPSSVPRERYGLRGITERARLFGGKATIDSAPGKGTRIVVELPLVEQVPAAVEAPRDAQ